MNRALSVIFNILISVLFVLSTAFVIYVSLVGVENAILNFALVVIFFALSYFVMPALHELGHVVMGKLVNFTLASVRLSFVEVVNTSEGKIVRFCSPFSLSTAGDCSMYPKTGERMRRRFFLWAGGGLLIQTLYLAVAVPLLFVFNTPLLWATLGATVPYCLYLFLINLLPFSSDYDGGIVWGLFRNEPSLQTALAILTAQGQIAQGKTVGEVDKELLFNLPQLPADDSYYGMIEYYRYLYYLDLGDDERAFLSARRMEDGLDDIPEVYLPTILLELAFSYSFLTDVKERAEGYHAQVLALKEEGFALDELRSKLAYARMTNNTNYEEELYENWKIALANEPILGVRRFEEKLMRRMRNEQVTE